MTLSYDVGSAYEIRFARPVRCLGEQMRGEKMYQFE